MKRLAILFACFTAVSFFTGTTILSAQNNTASNIKIDSGYHTSFDGTKIYYEQSGSGDPILLVHGFIVNGESWKKTALYNDLLTKGYQVITLDLRGNGRSDHPHTDEAYSQDAEAKDIMHLLAALGIRNYKAVGYSRGAIITARLLALDKNLTAAVLGGMGAEFTNPEWPRRIQFYKALSGEPNKDFEGAINYIKSQGLDREALALMQKHQPSTSKTELGKVSRPVLVISGDKDFDNGSAEELGALFKKATVKRIPGVHNDTNRTQAFADEVIRFITNAK